MLFVAPQTAVFRRFAVIVDQCEEWSTSRRVADKGQVVPFGCKISPDEL